MEGVKTYKRPFPGPNHASQTVTRDPHSGVATNSKDIVVIAITMPKVKNKKGPQRVKGLPMWEDTPWSNRRRKLQQRQRWRKCKANKEYKELDVDEEIQVVEELQVEEVVPQEESEVEEDSDDDEDKSNVEEEADKDESNVEEDDEEDESDVDKESADDYTSEEECYTRKLQQENVEEDGDSDSIASNSTHVSEDLNNNDICDPGPVHHDGNAQEYPDWRPIPIPTRFPHPRDRDEDVDSYFCDEDKLADAIARLKSSSYMTDRAMEKALKFMFENSDLISRMRNDEFSGSYKNMIRPYIVSKIVPVKNKTVMMKAKADGTCEIVQEDGLKSIKRSLYHTTGGDKLLRTEAYVEIAAIKDHYLRQHRKGGVRESTLQKDLKNLTLSADGIQESKKGRRTFHAVCIRFGKCVYISRILNPLTKDDDSKLTAFDIQQ